MTSSSDLPAQQPTQQPDDRPSTGSMTEAEKWASIAGGSAMVLLGLRQRSLRGVLTAIAGGGLAYRAATSEKSLPDAIGEATGVNKPIRVEKAVTISNKSPEELYNFWHNLENLPHFMKHLQSVQVIDQKRSHWVAKAPLGQSVEWDADIIGDIPNQFIAWASAENADVENSGFVKFIPAPGNRGTEVHVTMEYRLPGGAVASAIAKLFGEEPEQQIGDELRRFKQLMEAGELATTEGQSSGRKS